MVPHPLTSPNLPTTKHIKRVLRSGIWDLGSGIWEVGAKKAPILCVLLRRLPPTVPYSLVSLALVTNITISIIVVCIFYISIIIVDTIMNVFY